VKPFLVYHQNDEDDDSDDDKNTDNNSNRDDDRLYVTWRTHSIILCIELHRVSKNCASVIFWITLWNIGRLWYFLAGNIAKKRDVMRD